MKLVRLSGDVKAHAKTWDTHPGAVEVRLGVRQNPLEPWKLFRSHGSSPGSLETRSGVLGAHSRAIKADMGPLFERRGSLGAREANTGVKMAHPGAMISCLGAKIDLSKIL